MRIRPPQKRKPTDLTLQEIGLIGYIKTHLLNDGVFQQFDEITADDVLSTRSTINRVVHSLVNKNALIIVKESYRGPFGWFPPS
ncbi:MAG: hypothetical protein WBQ43_20500 [Terriglobales bacterium]